MRLVIFFGNAMLVVMLLYMFLPIFVDIGKYEYLLRAVFCISGLAAFLSLIFSNEKEQPPH